MVQTGGEVGEEAAGGSALTRERRVRSTEGALGGPQRGRYVLALGQRGGLAVGTSLFPGPLIALGSWSVESSPGCSAPDP